MARVTFSPLIADIRGKAADAVFASWKGRNYVRQRVTPANPNSAAQQLQRNAMAEAVAMWHLLSSTLKTAFGLGCSGMNISGYNDFVGRNVAAIKGETGLAGPRRNPAAAAPYMAIPIDMALTSTVTSVLQFDWTDPGSADKLAILTYDSTDNILVAEALSAEDIATETYATGAVYTVGNTVLVATFMHRVADSEMIHIATDSVVVAA